MTLKEKYQDLLAKGANPYAEMGKELINNDIGFVLGLAQYETGGCKGKD